MEYQKTTRMPVRLSMRTLRVSLGKEWSRPRRSENVFRLRARRQTPIRQHKPLGQECARDGRERRTRAQDHGSESTRSWFAARVSHDECRSPAVDDQQQQPSAAQVYCDCIKAYCS